ncbi:hypothetical protein [Streptomyces sp. NPDC059466]|uniref:hypothetical protein n=1 Tax=unclassified Streptomyces TaxID=2593676 RepID=UPI0036A65055
MGQPGGLVDLRGVFFVCLRTCGLIIQVQSFLGLSPGLAVFLLGGGGTLFVAGIVMIFLVCGW